MKYNTWHEILSSYDQHTIASDETAAPFLNFMRLEEKVAKAGSQGAEYLWTSHQIPGLLQTYGYAKSVITAPKGAELERHIQIRLTRSRLLAAAGVSMNFLVDSEGLDARVSRYRQDGKGKVIDEQLHHLISTLEADMHETEKLDFRLVPRQDATSAAHVDRTQIVLLDDGEMRYGLRDNRPMEQLTASEVEHNTQLWTATGSLALGREASLDHLRQLV